MAATSHSLYLTTVYRNRLRAIAKGLEIRARASWPGLGGLDAWPARMAPIVTQAQANGIRLSAGYLTAYLTSETGRRSRQIVIPSAPYAGISRDGRPLVEALRSPVIGAFGRRKQGDSDVQALQYGLGRAVRMVGFEAWQTPREALIDAITADERFSDFQRAVAGTCAACEALSATGGPHFEVHPNCECTPQPVVRGVPDRHPLRTGLELFLAKSAAEQDAQVGPEAAGEIRAGRAQLQDFVAHSPQELLPDFITQKPVAEVVN